MIPSKKKLKDIMLHTDCSRFLTVCKDKKSYMLLEIDELLDAIEDHMGDMARDIRKYLVEKDKK